MSNILTPLVNGVFNYGKWILNCWSKELPNYIEYSTDNTINISNRLFIPIGESKYNTQYLNISNDNVHTYIVGQSGSGKSNLVKVILSTIVNNYPNIQLYLLDYKRCELSLFKNTKNCIRFEYDEQQIELALNDLLEIVLNRYDTLSKDNYTNANDYNKYNGYQMKTIICMIEEISLMLKSSMKILRKIMAISRAVNVFIIFTTQRPSNEILDNVVKSLVGNRIVLKCEDKKNSMISLDQEGAELLKGNGNGYYKSNGEIYEFQTYYISDEVVRDICNRHKKIIKQIDNSNLSNENTDTQNVTIDNNNEWWCNL